jgi:UDP-glucose 4-epimerase
MRDGPGRYVPHATGLVDGGSRPQLFLVMKNEIRGSISLMSDSRSRRPKVLVTGGAGFMGRWLADQLALRYDVVIYDLQQPRADRPGQQYVKGDILDLDWLKRAMAGCSAVFHLAALVGVSECQAQEAEVSRINIDGTRTIATAVRTTPEVKSVLAISSSEVYGEGSGRLLTEISPLRPATAYGMSKLLLEQTMLELQSDTRHVTIIRPFNVYGPYQSSSFVISRFCELAHQGARLPIVGTGTQTRTFTYITDLVHGLLAAFDYGLRKRGGSEIFNVASKETCSILRLADLVNELAASPQTGALEHASPEELGRVSEQEIHHRLPSIEKAGKMLGFRPQVSLREGIGRTLAWYREIARDAGVSPRYQINATEHVRRIPV